VPEERKSISETKQIFVTVSSFLDPKSLLTCHAVSKYWNQVFLSEAENTKHWLHLCVARFGSANVRQWKEMLEGKEEEDEDEEGSNVTGEHNIMKHKSKKNEDEDDSNENDTTTTKSIIQLYSRMNEAFVKPHSHLYSLISHEGCIPLGHGAVNGIISAWVSIVERSNGETSRSVLLCEKYDGQQQQQSNSAKKNDDRNKKTPGQQKSSFYYKPLPIVEVRILIQNIGMADGAIVIPDQTISVDASTRRRGVEMSEVESVDERFHKWIMKLNGTPSSKKKTTKRSGGGGDLSRLYLFDAIILTAHIHAKGCSTRSKFEQRAKFTKIIAKVNGKTVPLVVPFKRNKDERKI